MKVNRRGHVTEYKKGNFYLSHVIWEDGHEEFEIDRCWVEHIAYSCDSNQKEDIFKAFDQLGAQKDDPELRKLLPESHKRRPLGWDDETTNSFKDSMKEE
jgi:hypothetical protein